MTPDDCLQKFWLTEELPSPPKNNFTIEQDCSKHYDETTTLADDGRFVVKMHFIKPTPKIGDSFKQAKLKKDAYYKILW